MYYRLIRNGDNDKMEMIPVLKIFKTAKTLQAERNAAFQAAAVAREARFVREPLDLTDPTAHVSLIADLHAPFHFAGSSGRRLDLNSASYLNHDAFGDARGHWTIDHDGCEVLTVFGTAKNVALWLTAYDR